MSILTLVPDYTLESTFEYSTLITKFENGVEQRRPRRANTLTGFKLNYKNRPLADLTTIQALFASQQGAFAAFTWTNPEDSVNYNVRFKQDTLTKQLKFYGLWDFTFELVIVL